MKKIFHQYYFFLFILCINNVHEIYAIRSIFYRSQTIATTMKTGTNPYFLTKYSLPELQKLHRIEQRKKISIANYFFENTTIHKNKELIATFLLMQKKMKLPCVIPLFEHNDSLSQPVAIYETNCASIVINKDDFYSLTPTQKCTTLLHELRHVQQHLSGIHMNISENDILQIQKIEGDAETFAAHAMQCFICYHILQHNAFDVPHPLGYFCKADYDPYLHNAIQKKQLCTAHRNFEISDLANLHPNVDFYCGPLKDRLPKKIKSLPIFSNQ